MSPAKLGKGTRPLGFKERALVFLVGSVLCVIAFVSVGTPIPRGRADRKAIITLLRELYPDREVAPANESTAPVAVLFHVIRSAEPDVARRVITFAAHHELGYAAPYVIERLGSGDARLEAAAQEFLRTIAGADFGPEAAAWRAWWRNPPRELLGLVVGEQTFAIAVCLGMALASVVLIRLGDRPGLEAASTLGALVLGLLWFTLFGLGLARLVAKQHVCTFGESRIAYYSKKGIVVGLEDAPLLGEWFVFVLIAAFVIGPLLLMWAWLAIQRFFGLQPQPVLQSSDDSTERRDAPV
jgi:hypothetical protein